MSLASVTIYRIKILEIQKTHTELYFLQHTPLPDDDPRGHENTWVPVKYGKSLLANSSRVPKQKCGDLK